MMLRFLRYVVAASCCLLSSQCFASVLQSGTTIPTASGTIIPAGSERRYVLTATGPFEGIKKQGASCQDQVKLATCVKMLVGQEERGSVVEAAFRDETHLLIIYTSDTGQIVPTELVLGNPSANTTFPFRSEAVSTAKVRQVLLSGDFCHPGLSPKPETCQSALFTNGLAKPVITGYVSGPGGVDTVPLRDVALEKNVVNVTFTAEPDFHPMWLVLRAKDANGTGADASESFSYVQAMPSADISAVYAISDLGEICGKERQPNGETPEPCKADTQFALASLTSGVVGSIEQLSREGNLLFTRMRTYNGTLPPTIAVVNTAKQSTLARLLTKPNAEQSALDVHLTVMDQETMRRNYGAGLAGMYLAVKIDMVNRTEKKLQFNKSAVWFDADFIETTSKYRAHFKDKASKATFDLFEANVYNSPFSSTLCSDRLFTRQEKADLDRAATPSVASTPNFDTAKKFRAEQAEVRHCKPYRFGIEQTERFYADGPLGILGSFDYLTQRTDRALRIVELFGGVLTTIVTGGAVAQVNTTALRDATAIVTGTVIPGSRAIIMNNAEINRQRANLVAQTFQEVVQIPSHATAATIVLLPREALISVQGYEKLVVLDRVIDVHIDPDVVNGVKDAPVPVGKLVLGYTKSQVRQALGEPTSVTTSPDGMSTFTYLPGPYQTVNFNKEGQSITWTPRSLTEQLGLAETLESAKEILRLNSSIGKELVLRDNSVILVAVPGATTVQHYSRSGKHDGTYALLYDSIQAIGKGKTKLQFEKMLGALRLPMAEAQTLPSYKILDSNSFADYEMPDVRGGMIHVVFSGTALSDKDKEEPKVTAITFTGEMP